MSATTSDTATAVRFDHFIDNAAAAPVDGSYFPVTNPATGEVIGEAALGSSTDVDRAVDSAAAAFSGEWSTWRAADRAAFLIRFGQLVGEHGEELALLQVAENGKLAKEMIGQTRLMPEHFNYYAGLAQQPLGTTNPVHLTQMLNYTVREPLGVVGAITPWNSPLMLLVWKLGPALAAGNTVVAKPSEITPLSTVRFAELAAEAGLPPGVFNVVTGFGDPVGTRLTTHPDVKKIAFTGSTATGVAIAAAASKTLKRLSLELGGKSPNIVFDDADLATAMNGILAGIFGASGQTCMAGSRVLVQETIYDQIVDELTKRADAITVGDPKVASTQMGTVASEAQFNKVMSYIDSAQTEGATLAAGGVRATVEDLPHGLFLRPTVFSNVDNDMVIAREEVFGPVAAVIRFTDEEDAIRIANDTDFGLAAAVWTTDVARAHRVASKLRAGTVWINNYRKSGYATPFGGFGLSGLDRENGPEALHAYTEVKSVWVDMGQGVTKTHSTRGHSAVRAAVLRSTGHSRPFTQSRPLTIEDVELTPPGPGQLQLRMASAGLCHSDLSVITGTRAKPVPAVAGHEGAGVVTMIGPGVTDMAVGDHVVLVFVSACGTCRPCVSGRPALCERSWSARSAGRLADGTSHLYQDGAPLYHWSGLSAFAEEAVVSRASVVRIDPDVPLLDAAVFGCAVVTGVGAVLNTAAVRPGDTVAVSGLGGVGLSAVMGAVLAGAREVIAIDPVAEKRELAESLGATRTFDATSGDIVEQVGNLTDGGVDYCFEMSGASAALTNAYGMIRRGGALVIASLPAPAVELSLPVAAMVSDEKRVLGSYMGSSVPSRDIPRYVQLYQRGRLPVDRLRSSILRLEDVNDGFERLAEGRAVRDVIDFS